MHRYRVGRGGIEGLRGRPQGRQHVELGRDCAAGCDQVGHEAFVHVHVAFVFAQVADVMALGEHPLDFGTKAEGVW